jgi:methionine biosynthesis protein MetW
MLSEYYDHKGEYVKISGGRMQGLKTLLGNYSGKKILDIGCGEGVLGRTLKEKAGVIVHGIDISTDAVQKARTVLDAAYMVDIENDNLPAQITSTKYDFVTMSEVLEHLFYPERVLEKLKVFRENNTKIIISVPNVLFWRNRLKIFFGHFEYTAHGLMDRGHIHFFSWKSFVDMIKKEGYHIEANAHHVPTRIMRPFANLFPGLFAFQFIVRISYRGERR